MGMTWECAIPPAIWTSWYYCTELKPHINLKGQTLQPRTTVWWGQPGNFFTSASFLAEISVSSPRKLSIFITQKIFFGSKYPKNTLFKFENGSTVLHPYAIWNWRCYCKEPKHRGRQAWQQACHWDKAICNTTSAIYTPQWPSSCVYILCVYDAIFSYTAFNMH